MADDPYQILGVSRTATDDEIRRRFLRLVNELHPDRNKEPGAEERFKKVTAANTIIGDPENRRRYDRGEIDANGEPRRSAAGAGAGFGGGFGGFGGRGSSSTVFDSDDPFADIFSAFRSEGRSQRARGPQKGQDTRYTLDVEFLEAATGAKKRVTLPGGGMLDIAVPAGVIEGQTLRLKGKGQPSPNGGAAGDALIEVRIKSHPTLKRQGNDIHHELPVSLDEAVLGAKVDVPTITGRVQLTIPPGTSAGRVFRLKGKGISPQPGGAPGDQFVTVRIVLPQEIDDDLATFMAKWREKHPYDPGRR
ncbi:MAG: DnaJ C-terminal domain-containing protein [Hyphomicrobium sp.]|nr:DnaJ C-terminal domain-containing protein [Hyphomicrobium sp.]